jgi:DNA-binding transcriptional LysR family regulator
MSNKTRTLWSLRQIAVFEAAARNGNFSRAAAELGMTQAAVSTAMRALESSLNVNLFRRLHRGAELTAAGQRLYKDVAAGLAQIGNGIEAVRPWREGQHVTLSVSTAFATYWLLPRLDDFRRLHPGIDLRIVTTDRDLDIRQDGIALGVRYGEGVLPHYRTAFLAPEMIYPVCSPAYLARSGQAEARLQAGDLYRLPLLHLEEPFRPCPNWTDWFRSQGLAAPSRFNGLRFNDYALLVQAVLEGAGVALGWAHLLDRQIERGLLMRPVEGLWTTSTSFQIVWAEELGPQAVQVRDWLVGQGKEWAAKGLTAGAGAPRPPA